VDRGAGNSRSHHHCDERPRLWRDQARPQDATSQGRRFFADLQDPDLGQLAALVGIPFWKVQSADAFGTTVEQSIAHKGPSLVEVDMTEVGEFPAYYPFNQRPAA
jgi:acetolactate synthase-1/2/3 large subunit